MIIKNSDQIFCIYIKDNKFVPGTFNEKEAEEYLDFKQVFLLSVWNNNLLTLTKWHDSNIWISSLESILNISYEYLSK